MYLSICEIINQLTLGLSKKYDPKEVVSYIELNHFSLEMIMAFEEVFSHNLLENYLKIFKGDEEKRS